MHRIALAGFLAFGLAAPALAQEDGTADVKPLTGTFYMAPAMDAEDANAPVDHIYMSITGDAAKAMWDAIQVDPTPDECVGRMARWVQSMVCYGPATQMSGPLAPGDSPYECYLGVNLKNATLELGQDC